MILSAPDILFFQNRFAYTGDERAYQKLFFHFHPALYRFTNNIVKNGAMADEIVSDVMMKVWEMGSKLAQVEKLDVYLYTSVKNASLTRLSKKKTENEVLTETFENTVIDNSADPENRLVLSELQQKIEDAVESLAPQCRLVYRLIKEEGFAHKDVCDILQVSQNTIETHMRIALKKIRLSLAIYLVGKK